MPLVWRGEYVNRQTGLYVADNVYDAFADEFKTAGSLYLGGGNAKNSVLGGGVRFITDDVWHTPKNQTRGSYTKEYIVEAADLQANTEQYITFWTKDDVGGNPWVNNRSCILRLQRLLALIIRVINQYYMQIVLLQRIYPQSVALLNSVCLN